MAGRINIDVSRNTAEAGATQINNVTNNFALDPEQIDLDCLRALQCPDPFRVKNQLKASKDVLLRESFEWILHDPHYLRWRDGEDVALLWIKGGAGKGKTMMSIGLVEELSRPSRDTAVVVYFFCQNADSSLNTVNAIIKGLIHQLVRERPSATQELRAKWDHIKGQFTTAISQEDLWDIFLAMLDRCKHDRIFVVLDALDECEQSIDQLLRQIVSTGVHQPSHIKWLLTSRPLDVAEQILLARSNQVLVSLELNLDLIAQSVVAYVSMKVAELTRIWRNCSQELRSRIEQELVAKAGGTFLWVSLMCKELQQVAVEDALSTIKKAPAGLQAAYERAYKDLCTGHPTDVAGCTQLLRVMMLAFRPLNLLEAYTLMCPATDNRGLESWVARSASFVQIQREGIPKLAFTHQSARDYLAGLDKSIPIDAPTSIDHTEIALRCFTYLTDNLTADLLHPPACSAPRLLILKNRDELPTGLGYPAEYCVMHLTATSDTSDTSSNIALLKNNGVVRVFLLQRFLEWLEFLSVTDRLERAWKGLHFLLQLERLQEHQDSDSYSTIVQDAYQFLNIHRDTISHRPLLVYSSALIFSPEFSEIRQLNLTRIPKWLRHIPEIKAEWSTFERLRDPSPAAVTMMVYSPDRQLIASASHDLTLKLWKTQTGKLQCSLKGHCSRIASLTFSLDGQLLASGDSNGAIKLWEVQTGRLCSEIEAHSNQVQLVIFSHDRQLLASGSTDGNVTVWEAHICRLEYTLKGRYNNTSSVTSMTFSPNGQLIASGGSDGTVKLWDTRTGRLRQTLRDLRCVYNIDVVAFSPDGQLIASAGRDHSSMPRCVKVWKLVSQPSSIKDVVRTVFRQSPKWREFRIFYANKRFIKRLHFSHDSDQLITDYGYFLMSDTERSSDLIIDSNTNELSLDYDRWIRCGPRRLFYIPVEYEPRCSDSHDDEIAIGCWNGEVLHFSIDRALALSSTALQSSGESENEEEIDRLSVFAIDGGSMYSR